MVDFPQLKTMGKDSFSNTGKDRVRFSKYNSSLTDMERARRKEDALNFLRSGSDKPAKSKVRSVEDIVNDIKAKNRQRDPMNKKTYELLGEQPIKNLSTKAKRSLLSNDRIIDDLASESLRKARNRISTGDKIRSSHGRASQNNRTTSLLNSLSNFGSKLLSSILYSENSPNLHPPNLNETVDKMSPYLQYQPLQDNFQQREIDATLALKKAKLDKLNREIVLKEQKLSNSSPIDLVTENKDIKSSTDYLDQKLNSILGQLSNDSNGKLLNELSNIKNEIISLKKRQETNNMNFESKFEDMRIEQQRSKRHFDRMMQDLEEKREEIDRQKDQLIRLYKKAHKRPRSFYESDLETDDDSDGEINRRNIVSSNKRQKTNIFNVDDIDGYKHKRGNHDEDDDLNIISKLEKVNHNMSRLTRSTSKAADVADKLSKSRSANYEL